MVKWRTEKKGLRLPLQNKKATFNRQYQESCWIVFFFNSKPRQNYTVDWTSEKNTLGVTVTHYTPKWNRLIAEEQARGAH